MKWSIGQLFGLFEDDDVQSPPRVPLRKRLRRIFLGADELWESPPDAIQAMDLREHLPRDPRELRVSNPPRLPELRR